MPEYVHDFKNVTSVGIGAFAKAHFNGAINLPKVQSLPNAADCPEKPQGADHDYGVFEGSNLDTINLSSLKTIGSRAFYDCSNMTCNFSSTRVTSIGEAAFAHAWISSPPSMADPKTVYFPSVTSIVDCTKGANWGTGVFEGSYITEYDFSTVTHIGARAFKGCQNLGAVKGAIATNPTTVSIYFPNVTSIGEEAFHNAFSRIRGTGGNDYTYVDIYFPSLTRIEDAPVTTGTQPTVNGCGVFESNGACKIDFPNLEYIGNRAFYSSSNLGAGIEQAFQSPEFPKVTHVGKYAFAKISLRSNQRGAHLIMPNVETIDDNAFFGSLVYPCEITLLPGPGAESIEYKVVNLPKCTQIGKSGFACEYDSIIKQIFKILLPKIETLGDYAFKWVGVPVSLQSEFTLETHIGSDCTTIGRNCFQTISAGTISEGVSSNSMYKIINGVRYPGGKVGKVHKWDLYFYGDVPPTLDVGFDFDGSAKISNNPQHIYVPDNKVEVYKNAWKAIYVGSQDEPDPADPEHPDIKYPAYYYIDYSPYIFGISGAPDSQNW